MKTTFKTILTLSTIFLTGLALPSIGSDLIAKELVHKKSGLRVANVNAYYSGGNTIGGSHPTAAAWSFTVPEGNNRLLLVITNAKADPSLSGKKSLKGRSISQRAMLTSLTYAGKPLQCMTTFDETTYDDRHAVFWYLLNPPVGTADLEAIQFPRDNGGELFAAAYALTGVNQQEPFDQPLRFITERNQHHSVKCRPGGMVVAELKAIKLARPDPSQVVRYANDKSRTGSTAVGGPEVRLSWNWEKQFLRKEGGYRAAPRSGGVIALAVHPQHAFDESSEAKTQATEFQPLALRSAKTAERPGLEVTLYDLSSLRPEKRRGDLRYKKPSYGYRIPDHYEKQKVLVRKSVRNVDFKYDFKHSSDLNYEKGFLGSGVRDNFVAEFKGVITLPETGQYVFELNSNDQAKLYLGDRLIIDNHGNNSFTMKMASLDIERGRYAIRVVYLEEKWKNPSVRQPHGVRLGWRPPSGYPTDMPIQLWKLEKGVHPVPALAFTHEPRE